MLLTTLRSVIGSTLGTIRDRIITLFTWFRSMTIEGLDMSACLEFGKGEHCEEPCLIDTLLGTVLNFLTFMVIFSSKTSSVCPCHPNPISQTLLTSQTCHFRRLFWLQNKEQMIANDPYGGLIRKGAIDVGFIHAFIASLSVIIVSELGDKTFFIAAIMAMRHSRIVVFGGAISALFIMTVMSGKDLPWIYTKFVSIYYLIIVSNLYHYIVVMFTFYFTSAVLGYATTVIPRWFTYYASSALFAIFGLKMLKEGTLNIWL